MIIWGKQGVRVTVYHEAGYTYSQFYHYHLPFPFTIHQRAFIPELNVLPNSAETTAAVKQLQ